MKMKMKMKKSLIIFDLDGTIQDSSLIISGAVNYVREALGLEPMEEEIIIKNINNRDIEPAKFFYDSKKFSVVHQNLFLEFYENSRSRLLKVYDGLDRVIFKLK
jgi:phosphoglycolate phosphatase